MVDNATEEKRRLWKECGSKTARSVVYTTKKQAEE